MRNVRALLVPLYPFSDASSWAVGPDSGRRALAPERSGAALSCGSATAPHSSAGLRCGHGRGLGHGRGRGRPSAKVGHDDRGTGHAPERGVPTAHRSLSPGRSCLRRHVVATAATITTVPKASRPRGAPTAHRRRRDITQGSTTRVATEATPTNAQMVANAGPTRQPSGHANPQSVRLPGPVAAESMGEVAGTPDRTHLFLPCSFAK